MTDWPNDGGLSARHIRDACEASLRRLQTDHIDLYQMHHVDRNAPWDEVWQAMETLVEQGKVHLRRQQQLRGLAHRAGERSRGEAQLPRPRERAEPLQPRVAHGRARGAARVPRLRPRRHPVEPARGRDARRHERLRRHRAAQEPEPALRGDAPAAREVGEVLRRARRGAGRGRARVAACSGARSPRRSSDRARSSNSKARRCARPRSRSTTTRSKAINEIFPGPGKAPEAYAW